jgi:hypothetical protein
MFPRQIITQLYGIQHSSTDSGKYALFIRLLNKLTMVHKTQQELITDGFILPCQATEDTEWVSDPADPTMHETGPIRQGETIWVHHELFGSGPTWEPARLMDNTLRFVQPHHFGLKIRSANPAHSNPL